MVRENPKSPDREQRISRKSHLLRSASKLSAQKVLKNHVLVNQPTVLKNHVLINQPTIQPITDPRKDTDDLLEYAVDVENRLRSELHTVLKQLEQEREKTRRLERRLRQLADNSPSRVAGGSPGRAASPFCSDRGRASSPDLTANVRHRRSRAGAQTALGTPLPGSPSAWLQLRGGTGRPAALDRPDPADAMRSKPALLAACEHAIANDLRRLERAATAADAGDAPSPGLGAGSAGRARLEVFQSAFDAIIANFHVYGPLLSRIKAEYDAALLEREAALERAAASKVAERAEHHIAVHQASVTLSQRVRELESEVTTAAARAARYEAQLRDALREVEELQKLERAARILRRRSEESLEEAHRLNDAMVMERHRRSLHGDPDFPIPGPHAGNARSPPPGCRRESLHAATTQEAAAHASHHSTTRRRELANHGRSSHAAGEAGFESESGLWSSTPLLL